MANKKRPLSEETEDLISQSRAKKHCDIPSPPVTKYKIPKKSDLIGKFSM